MKSIVETIENDSLRWYVNGESNVDPGGISDIPIEEQFVGGTDTLLSSDILAASVLVSLGELVDSNKKKTMSV